MRTALMLTDCASTATNPAAKANLSLLLHGGGVDSAHLSWSPIIAPLGENFRVFAPDLPGYGQSDKPDVVYSIEYYTDFLRNLMDCIGS